MIYTNLTKQKTNLEILLSPVISLHDFCVPSILKTDLDFHTKLILKKHKVLTYFNLTMVGI